MELAHLSWLSIAFDILQLLDGLEGPLAQRSLYLVLGGFL